jgi:hypothetical protein
VIGGWWLVLVTRWLLPVASYSFFVVSLGCQSAVSHIPHPICHVEWKLMESKHLVASLDPRFIMANSCFGFVARRSI